MQPTTDVAIVGAGPYGLSLAAHLRARGIDHRIFGRPMEAWQTQMPAGMFLKSEGYASNIDDPEGNSTLARFCDDNRHSYRQYGMPIPVERFVAYGLAFQRKHAPALQQTMVQRIQRLGDGFLLHLDGGEAVTARRVVVSIGCRDFRYIPPPLTQLPRDYLSHSSDRSQYQRFAGQEVCVVGSGASALDVAAALATSGASVQLVARRRELLWTSQAVHRPRFEWWYMRNMMRAGRWGQGNFYSDAPMVFRHFPARARLSIVRSFVGPRGGWPVKSCVEQLPQLLGSRLTAAEVQDGRVMLALTDAAGRNRQLVVDHVFAGTGFSVRLKDLPLLDETLGSAILALEDTPVLSAHFESSVPGLYFTGLAAANTFGPLMRFVAGTRFSSRRIARDLARKTADSRPVAATR